MIKKPRQVRMKTTTPAEIEKIESPPEEKPKGPTTAWFYDTDNQVKIELLDASILDSNNSGDYKHHDWEGPFKSFSEAKKAGMEKLRSERNLISIRMREFDSLRFGAIKGGK